MQIGNIGYEQADVNALKNAAMHQDGQKVENNSKNNTYK